jgi:hypothetical protein
MIGLAFVYGLVFGVLTVGVAGWLLVDRDGTGNAIATAGSFMRPRRRSARQGGENEDDRGADLVAKMTESAKEFTFQEISQICYEEGLFEWMMEGKEFDGVYTVTPKCRSAMGRLLSRYAPSTDGNKVARRCVRSGKAYYFGTRCKGRHCRYFIQDTE